MMPPEDNPADDVPADRESYEAWEAERKPVFTNCNVCGRQLITTDEDEMGMCQICARE